MVQLVRLPPPPPWTTEYRRRLSALTHAWYTQTMKLDENDRAKLLPRSGIGVIAPWLVIMPPGNPAICIDLRMLDGVRIGAPDDGVQADADEDNDHAFEWPGQPYQWPGQPDPACHLMLSCGDLEIALYIADGPEAVRGIVQQAAPLLRSATDADHNAFVLVDDVPVRHRGEYLQVGPSAYRISEVREYAVHGANIPLGNGHLLQAATALLVVAASERNEARASSADERND